MKNYFTLFASFFCLITYSQTWINLIPNYSLEEISNDYPSPSTDGNNLPDCSNPLDYLSNSSYDYITEYWGNVVEWTHPLKKSICLACPRVGTADLRTFTYHGSSSTYARSGTNWGYTDDDGEFLVVPLKGCFGGNLECLNENKTYYIEVFHSGTSNDNKIYLTENQPKVCGFTSSLSNSNNAQKILEFDGSVGIPNQINWTRYRGYFSPDGTKKWLSLTGGSWDDIRIYEVTNNLCRDNWYFDNTVFNYPTEIFRATDKLYIGEGTDPESNLNGGTHISGPVKALAGSNTVVKAGNEILIDGTPPCNGCTYSSFEIEEGAYFETVIEEDCGALCPITTGFPEEVYVCDGQPTNIGDALGESWGTDVSWFPEIDLDAADVMNPTFTPPSNSGQRTYTVSYTTICSGFEDIQTYEVTVVWKDYTPPQLNLTEIYSDEYEYEFEIDGNDGVDQVNIEISDGSQIVYNTSLHRNVDFTSFPFNWSTTQATNTVIGFEVPINFSSCKNHVITVTAINKCDNSNVQASLNWNNSVPLAFTGPFPNTFTPDGNGVNDEYCISNYQGADSYEFIVKKGNAGTGANVATGSGIINSGTTCIWDGIADNGNPALDNYHVIIITLKNKCGDEIGHAQLVWIPTYNNMPLNDEHEMTNNRIIFNDNNKFGTNDSTDYELTIQNTSLNDKLGIYPNPSEGKFWVKGVKYYNEIKIYDPKGKCIYTHKNENGQDELNIDVSHQISSGIYNLVLHSDTGKDVVQLIFN